MKIWEKNYLLTVTLLLCLLYGSIFFIQQYSFRINLEKYCENSLLNEGRIEYVISFFMEEKGGQRLKWYAKSLEKQNIYLEIRDNNEILADTLPVRQNEDLESGFHIIRDKHKIYACIGNSCSNLSSENVSVSYLEDISDLYSVFKKQAAVLLFFAAFTSLFLSGTLYLAMKKIYAPVNNIAHELRTPLTAIQGYTQYMMLGNISGEDREFACKEIEKEAGYMNMLIENLLIMGNLRDGRILMKRVESDFIVKEMEQHFPFLQCKKETEYLYGDGTLLFSLLKNLVSNTCRQGENVSLVIEENLITIWNKDDSLEEEMRKKLNSGRLIPREKIKGKGLGVSLCREIVKMHHGKLVYENVPEEGLKIRVFLWQGGNQFI